MFLLDIRCSLFKNGCFALILFFLKTNLNLISCASLRKHFFRYIFLDYRFLTLEHSQLFVYVATRTKLINFDVNYLEKEVNKKVKLMTPSSYNLGQSN